MILVTLLNPLLMQVKRIYGNWKAGWSLDRHTVSSRVNPDGTFNTIRSDTGELLYRLKYCQDTTVLDKLATTVSRFISEKLVVFDYLSALIPVPPSCHDRQVQPVLILASKIGALLQLPTPDDYLLKAKNTPPMKNISDPDIRRRFMDGAFAVRDDRFAGKYVLLFDDIYSSGTTLSAATDALKNMGGIARVFTLTLTRTRAYV